MLKISNLTAGTDSTQILTKFSLSVGERAVIVLMGPNGSGKSTLAHILAGHPTYQVNSGSIEFQGHDLLSLAPEERAAAGLFLAFQYPPSIPGVSVSQFLRLALNAQEKQRGNTITPMTPFLKNLREQMKFLEIPIEFSQRSVNEDFSGGEKKRLEMLQMLILQPELVLVDEIDSGLDIDAIKVVAKALNHIHSQGSSILIITHYQRILNYLKPDKVHIVQDGHISRSGGWELVEELESKGYTDKRQEAPSK